MAKINLGGWSITENSTAGTITFSDGTNTNFKIHDTGLVEAPNGNLRIDTNQSVEDGNGTNRLQFDGDQTLVNGNGGRVGFQVKNGVQNSVWAYSDQPFEIKDREGVFTALSYKTSANAPGTLELTNSSLTTNRTTYKNGNPNRNNIKWTNSYGAEIKQYTGGAGAGNFDIENSEGGAKLRVKSSSNSGEVQATDSSGNTTTLT